MRRDPVSRRSGAYVPGIRVRAIADVAALRAIEAEHHALFASCSGSHVGTAFPYVIADAATGPPERPWQLFAAWRDGELAGCLYGRRVERTVMRMRLPVFQLGPHFVADPLVAPVDPDATLRGLLEALEQDRRDCAMFFFPRLSTAAFERLARAASELGLPWRWQWASYAYAFDATVGLDAFLAGLEGDKRRELGRRGRRLGREHACAYVREEGLGAAADMERFEEFMALEDSGWKGRDGTSIRRRPGYEPYFREVVRSASRAGLLAWYTLRADDRPIAKYLTLRAHDTLWLPKIGYDERFAAHAPGMLLKHHVLTECMTDGAINRVDNVSAAPWVRVWNPVQVPFRSMTLFGRNPRSTFLRGVRAGRGLARRLLGRPEVLPGPGDRPFL